MADDLSLPGLFHPERKYSLASQAALESLRADMQTAHKRISALCMNNRFSERPELKSLGPPR